MSQNSAEMPRYQCHKKVWALKIAEITTAFQSPPEVAEPRQFNVIIPEDKRYAPFEISFDYIEKHNPQPGGYYVQYEGGYESYSPAEAFESGYTRI
ncbi:hypothetical protein [Cronobacter dublinensis]|uniref:hypothetical protein n=1 Tax=Cronobacter dublinensis TaxID=413497 RepID=UPI000CFBA510|nr:hypothetical protein [Cronobacter dublinensis]